MYMCIYIYIYVYMYVYVFFFNIYIYIYLCVCDVLLGFLMVSQACVAPRRQALGSADA